MILTRLAPNRAAHGLQHTRREKKPHYDIIGQESSTEEEEEAVAVVGKNRDI